MAESTYDRRDFDENFRRFLNISEKILKKKDELSGDLDLEGKGNPLQKCLHQYMRCYAKTSPQEREEFHVDLIRDIFSQHEHNIIENGHEDASWLLDNNLIIVYGSNMGLGNKSRIRIYLSHIFEMAMIMKTDAEKRLRGKPEEEYAAAEELNYPDAYLLYLYRIFKSLRNADPKITARLTIIISDLEEKLGLSEGTQNMNPGTGSGMDGLLQFATGMMGQMGLPQPGGGAAPPSGDDVGKALQSVFGNPKTQETISTMFQDLDKSNDIGDVIGKLVNGMSNPQFKEAIGESLNGLADGQSASNAAPGDKSESEPPTLVESSAVQNSAAQSQSESSQTSQTSEVPIADEEIPIVSDD